LNTPLVVDASVAVQLILQQDATTTADAVLLRDTRWLRLIAPSILASETAAAITKKLRRLDIDETSAREAFDTWRDMLDDEVFELTPANDLLDAAFELSLQRRHSLHDCLYLALAQANGAALATRDTALAQKAQELGIATELIHP
jgi:predicted nucleic acid-binding protein